MNTRNTLRRNRLVGLGLLLAGVMTGTALLLWAGRDTVTFFMTPAEAQRAETFTSPIYLGGTLAPGSLQSSADGRTITFVLTENGVDQAVTYTGVVPDLVTEGTTVIAYGRLERGGMFQASRILAKHDENYRPPGFGEDL
ncbi:MAG: cytochrome c maturation protein CcmE [Pseudomonadota bacterium]